MKDIPININVHQFLAGDPFRRIGSSYGDSTFLLKRDQISSTGPSFIRTIRGGHIVATVKSTTTKEVVVLGNDVFGETFSYRLIFKPVKND
jgi:hypothetical protein